MDRLTPIEIVKREASLERLKELGYSAEAFAGDGVLFKRHGRDLGTELREVSETFRWLRVIEDRGVGFEALSRAGHAFDTLEALDVAAREPERQSDQAQSLREIASGRDRKRAAAVIFERLEEIKRAAEFYPTPNGLQADVTIGALELRFLARPDGTCFYVERIDERGYLMTGYLNPSPPGKYVDGRLHVMTWKRGWEAQLF